MPGRKASKAETLSHSVARQDTSDAALLTRPSSDTDSGRCSPTRALMSSSTSLREVPDWRDEVIQYYRNESIKAWKFYQAACLEKYKLNLTMSRWDASDYYAHQSMVLDTDDNVTEMKKMIIFERMKRELTNHAKEIDDKEELAHRRFADNVRKLDAGKDITALAVIGDENVYDQMQLLINYVVPENQVEAADAAVDNMFGSTSSASVNDSEDSEGFHTARSASDDTFGELGNPLGINIIKDKLGSTPSSHGLSSELEKRGTGPRSEHNGLEIDVLGTKPPWKDERSTLAGLESGNRKMKLTPAEQPTKASADQDPLKDLGVNKSMPKGEDSVSHIGSTAAKKKKKKKKDRRQKKDKGLSTDQEANIRELQQLTADTGSETRDPLHDRENTTTKLDCLISESNSVLAATVTPDPSGSNSPVDSFSDETEKQIVDDELMAKRLAQTWATQQNWGSSAGRSVFGQVSCPVPRRPSPAFATVAKLAPPVPPSPPPPPAVPVVEDYDEGNDGGESWVTVTRRPLNVQPKLPVKIDNGAASSMDPRMNLYKTALCWNFENRGYCTRGSECRFAHGNEELQSLAGHEGSSMVTRKFAESGCLNKTSLCWTFRDQGTCPWGTQCIYAHGKEELKPFPDWFKREDYSTITQQSRKLAELPEHSEPCHSQLCPARLQYFLKKTIICKQWLADRCRYPLQDCKFAHGQADLKPLPKYEMCKRHSYGGCHLQTNECVYAHSKLELREPDERYKAAMQQQNCSSLLTHTTQPHLGEDVVTAGADYTESHDYQWLQDVDDCIICSEDFSTLMERSMLGCGHNRFHVKCINQWLTRDASCPVCRQPVSHY